MVTFDNDLSSEGDIDNIGNDNEVDDDVDESSSDNEEMKNILKIDKKRYMSSMEGLKYEWSYRKDLCKWIFSKKTYFHK